MLVPNSIKPTLPISSHDFLSEVSDLSGVWKSSESCHSRTHRSVKTQKSVLGTLIIRPCIPVCIMFGALPFTDLRPSEKKGTRSVSRSCSHGEPPQTRTRGSKRVRYISPSLL